MHLWEDGSPTVSFHCRVLQCERRRREEDENAEVKRSVSLKFIPSSLTLQGIQTLARVALPSTMIYNPETKYSERVE